MRNPAKGISLAVATGAMAALLWSTNVQGAGSDTVTLSPATTMWATRGLTQTVSAEPMGTGRLTVSLMGTWYRQKLDILNAAPVGAGVMTGIVAFSLGINQYIDIFGGVDGYSLLATKDDYGLGSVIGGLQGVVPLPTNSPLRLGAQLAVIGGTASDQINGNNADGYNFFETRTEYEFMGKIIETLKFGNDSLGIKLHFNQGGTMLLQGDNRKLLLLGAGIQGLVHPMVIIGLEANSRTYVHDINIQTDPLWLTPSVTFRTPYYFNVFLGIDISLSENRTAVDRALEPYRVFGGLVSSLDLLAGKRRAEREKALREKMENERKIREAQARNARLARKVYEDSVALVKSREAEARRADSMAQKALADSIALVDVKKKLEEERSKRSDAEKQLLSTGLLLLDAVYFETGKAQISINSFPYLNIIGKMLAKYPKLQIEVSGHTDNVGKYDNNMTLSQARAETVRRYLIQVAPDLLTRISARGYGSTQPKAPNTTADGRKMNRRVELQVLNKEVLKEYN